MGAMLTLVLLMVGPQQEDLMGQFQKQVEIRREDAKSVVAIYLELFKNGVNAEGLDKLGLAYMDQRKPIQAAAIFEHALSLDPNFKDLKTHSDAAKQEVDQKNAKMAELEDRERLEKSPARACGRAAILFHLGFLGDAVDVLDDARKAYPLDQDVPGLLATFKMGIAVDTIVVKMVLQDFDAALQARDEDKALSALAAYHFYSLGTGDASKLVERISTTFGDASKAKVLEVLAKTAS